MNHTHFPKEDHLPDWVRRDNKGTKGDRVDIVLEIWIRVIRRFIVIWHDLLCVRLCVCVCVCVFVYVFYLARLSTGKVM